MDKILYIMHVDWHWIKQRPHFVAEGLSSDFDLVVLHPHNNRRTNLVSNRSNLTRVPILSLPFSRLKGISFINACIREFYIFLLILFFRPSIVWVTFPTLISKIGLRMLKNTVIIYDCMDDAQEFSKDEVRNKYISNSEKALLGVADIVFVSSENLYNKVLGRGASANKLALVRNAFGGTICAETTTSIVSGKPKDSFRILYIGTISDYIDFNLLLYCVDSLNGVEFHFFGPVLVDVPAHDRLKFHGTIEHSSLSSRAHKFDCFIMPFVTNELIQGVDPVKIYEYINLNKNIICPYYKEIDRFSEFVSFYKDRNGFVEIVKCLVVDNKTKYTLNQRSLFLNDNSWEVRLNQISKSINECLRLKS
ncbi:MAG: hypothetical protein AB7D06_18205 [Pedobacter sp.]